MSQMLEIVRHYALGIRNGRRPEDALRHLKSEVAELEVEVENGGKGADGIKGEVMDVINCALDVLFLAHPEVTMDELDGLMEAKCAKWVDKYAKDDHETVSSGAPSGGAVLRELHSAGISKESISRIAGIEVDSVERILGGSMSFKATQDRLNSVVPLLREAVGGDVSRLPYVLEIPDATGTSLQDLLSDPVVDLESVRRYIRERSSGGGNLCTAERAAIRSAISD